MKKAAIISEFNPYHNGHSYLAEKIREATDCDYIISLMGGNFLQRGDVAMIDKYSRAAMACSDKIDLVLELPFVYATGSAYDFANGAVNILNRLGSIDYLCFGAETDNIQAFNTLADILCEEPDTFKYYLKDALSSGMSYPAARTNAIMNYTSDKDLSELIKTPNNILALEYICALKRSSSNIKPIMIKRTANNYHDKTIDSQIASATAIRELTSKEPFDDKSSLYNSLKAVIPCQAAKYITDSYKECWPVDSALLTPYIQNLLIFNEYVNICDMNEGLVKKLKDIVPSISYDELSGKLKTKDITESRIKRAIIHAIFKYTDDDRTGFVNEGYGLYANILSFKRDSSAVIKDINETSSIPLITKKADFYDYISRYNINHLLATKMWDYDLRATSLYNCMIYNRYNKILPSEQSRQIPII